MQTHSSVIENFIREGKGGKGTYVKATDDVLYSEIPLGYRPYGHMPWRDSVLGQKAELAVRLKDGSILTNGARFDTPIDQHQRNLISALEESRRRFSVVPFHSITAAWTDGEIDDWSQAPFGISDLHKEVSVIVPSGSEEWKLVKVKDIESNKKRYSAEFGFRIGEFRGEVLSDQRRPSITFYTPFANVDAEETWGIFEAAPDQAAECPGSRHSRYSLLVRPFKEVAFEYFDVTWLPQVGVARQQPGSEGSQK